ncbi:Fic/DOC family protein [Oribacterium sp. NK2B42]|uniref:Fic/DOC family protein n=1 Tax=Oribacterium sp. NK2B42 TaxID=689781 RepID=UPI0003FFBBA5|nr:Fic family protein [Oribacterium sp. NK2B42]
MESIDHYKYPGEDILINEFNCHDAEELAMLEALSTGGNLAYLQMHPIKGKFDFKHLKEIHRFIFQDIYGWAGIPRDIDIGKGNLFCRAQFIDEFAITVFSDFYKSCYEAKKDKTSFVENLAKHYGDLNALHPFREGNGRSQREFARELCLKCGYILDLTQTNHKEMLHASILSFDSGDNSGLENIFDRCCIPKKEYKNLQKALTSKLLILSNDDVDSAIEERFFSK